MVNLHLTLAHSQGRQGHALTLAHSKGRQGHALTLAHSKGRQGHANFDCKYIVDFSRLSKFIFTI